ncbi:KAT8 regulatory NSL complex subunit 1 [Lucilia cuprina]|nr:KAT8 regulatory NSL complex subunit 1 [Lucilia cuprina]
MAIFFLLSNLIHFLFLFYFFILNNFLIKSSAVNLAIFIWLNSVCCYMHYYKNFLKLFSKVERVVKCKKFINTQKCNPVLLLVNISGNTRYVYNKLVRTVPVEKKRVSKYIRTFIPTNIQKNFLLLATTFLNNSVLNTSATSNEYHGNLILNAAVFYNMAPALTEPLSPTENLNSSAVTATTTPTTRSSRKFDSSNVNKSGINNSNILNTPTNKIVVKSASTVREKRNRSGGIIINQTPTTSKRITRSRDNQQRNLVVTPSASLNGENTSETPQNIKTPTTRRISKVASVQEVDTTVINSISNNNSSSTKNEQMGLSTAPLNTKNKILNNNNNNTSQNLDTVVVEDSNTKDTSTAQLLADLTNEAITAEICLRNQLKDVNLVKTTGDPSSPIIQQDTFVDTEKDIVVLKVASNTIAAAPEVNKTTTAHMETQLTELPKSSNVQEKSEVIETTSTTATSLEEFLDSQKDNNNSPPEEKVEQKVNAEEEAADKRHNDKSEHKEEKSLQTAATESYLDTANVHETPVGSPNSSDDAAERKKPSSKLEILSVQELPPVSTDSTMTASEVEDNLEERLSQLDGTAIDSPPPNNHDVDSNEKTLQNSVAAATPPRTPTHQQTLSHDLQELQQQLQHTPPTPVAQQVQTHQQHLQHQQQHSPQINCFTTTPQSTTSSINSLATTTVGGTMPPNQSYIKEADGVGVGAAAELEDQDIEEVFKVLKGFEGGTTSDLNVCDLNVLFNEVYMKINETELSGNAGSGTGSIASGGGCISSNTQSHITITNPSIQLVKPTQVEEGQLEIEKRQQQMQRKIDFLLRRLRKLQARYMCKHTSEEIAGLFEWSARQSSKGITNSATLNNEAIGPPDPAKCFLKVIAARPPASDWKDVQESLVPANQISTLLRKIESVANAQQLCTTPANSLVNITTHKKTKKALMEAQAAAAASNSSNINSTTFGEGKAEEVVVATLDENITDELSQVVGLLQTEMSEVQKAIDSDATESSSGGESADEMVTYNNTQQQTLPITKRAAWRYSRDRAAIASRWSWLLSQISDLEIKIRQHSELHQEIIRSKGLVTCGGGGGDNSKVGEQVNEEQMGSCRTRGYVPSLFRKRKLIQTTNIHTISKKAARPSTIKCGCQWPLHPCALCTGRLDPTAPRDLPDTMMMSDRIALLDSGYHPVLSFRENVNNALHFEAIAKQPEWQQRVMRCPAKNIAKNVWRAEREAVAAAAGGHHTTSSSKKYGDAPPAKRRYIKKKDRLNNDEKSAAGKSSHATTAGTQQSSTTSTAATVASSLATTSLNDVGNGTATLSTTTTTSTTPLVANKGTAKSAKKQHCPAVRDENSKEPLNSLPPPAYLSNTSLTATTSLPTTTTTTTIPNNNNKFIHQTSDCLPINYDQYNPNQTPSSLISNHNHNNNNSSSKNNKHRKLSSSTVVNSHHYNHLNNSSSNLYNGDSSYMFNRENWGGAGDNFNVRSRTSSPTHGSGSGNNYHKYERSLDRKNRTSYDIDNIVIPYSVAAATRVEILPYKEIPTPKWRVIEQENEENNKLKISRNQEESSDNKTLSECKPVTNGFICDDSQLLDSTVKKTLTTPPVKLEEVNENDLKAGKENLNENNSLPAAANSSNNTTEQDEKVIEEKCKIITQNSCSNSRNNAEDDDDVVHKDVVDDGDDDVDEENTKEPKLKKLKVEPSVIDNIRRDNNVEKVAKEKKKGITTDKEETEDDEETIALQNCSNVSIEEDEDISDDAMFLRHERALTEERRKFQTYLKFPWSTRSRANRRIDSRAESSGANTPDPSSPAPQTPSVGGGDLESIPSPLNPATPLDTISEAGDNSTSFLGVGPLPSLSSKRYERRRTTSTKRDRELERRSSTPDSKELIPPYEPLTFPLTDEQFEELMRAMPIDHGEDSKRFDDCYLPGGGGGGVGGLGAFGLGGILNNKYPRTISGSTSKRTSRSSTLCGDSLTTASGSRRNKSSNSKNLPPISADDNNVSLTHENGDMLMYDDDYEDDYPKHHLAPNDDHLTADSVGIRHVTANSGVGLYDEDDDDVYGDQYGAYVGRQQCKHRDSEGESSEEEPFQDDDPNDPEWRGETEERLRKKV